MKLLVATEFPPDAAGGGAAIVRQMLLGFPGEVHWWSIFSTKSFDAAGLGIISAQSGCPPTKIYPAGRFSQIKARLMRLIWTPFAARGFKQMLESVRPDCVWVIPHDWSIPPIHQVLVGGMLGRRESKKAGIKKDRVVRIWEGRYHTTIQDYPDAHHHPAHWGKAICRQLNAQQDDLYKLAATRDATSIPMLEDLERRTGFRGTQMLHQGLEKEDFEYLHEALCSSQQKKTLKIAYAGTVLVPKEFAAFVAALSRFREFVSLELHLWGAHSYRNCSWFDPEFIVEHGNLPQNELLDALKLCDWGFIPMSLEDKDPRYNRFSFPTKFITYLAAGLPVITMGHPQSSVMKMAKSYKVGVNLEHLDQHTEDLLRVALEDDRAKEKYRGEIIRCARDHFDASEMRKLLWKHLTPQTNSISMKSDK